MLAIYMSVLWQLWKRWIIPRSASYGRAENVFLGLRTVRNIVWFTFIHMLIVMVLASIRGLSFEILAMFGLVNCAWILGILKLWEVRKTQLSAIGWRF